MLRPRDWRSSIGRRARAAARFSGLTRASGVARLEIFHGAIENDAAVIDEHEVGEDVLDFFDLMGGDDDGAACRRNNR